MRHRTDSFQLSSYDAASIKFFSIEINNSCKNAHVVSYLQQTLRKKMNTKIHYVAYIILVSMFLLLGACTKPLESDTNLVSSVSSNPNVLDADVSTNVKLALMNNSGFSTLNIDIVTTNGDVSLTGLVNSEAQKKAIVDLVREVDGVHAIHEHLSIKP